MAAAPTRWGVISAGQISNDWVAAVSTLPKEEHVVIAVAARNVESATAFAKEHDIPKVHKSYEDLYKDPEVEVVYIGTLHTEHLRLVKQALDHGKHVLCEKPLAMNVKETKEIVDYARQKKLFFMEAIWSRFFPAYQRLKEELAKGTIGEVYSVVATMGIQFPEDNWRRDKKNGGGTTLDMGTYTTQFASLVFKGLKPVKIIAGGHLNSSGADDSASTTIIYPNGKTATLLTHGGVNLPNDALAVGTKGTLKLRDPFWCATTLETPEGVLEFELPKTDKRMNFWNCTGLSYQVKEVRRCLLEGLTESPEITLDETLFLAELRESIRKQIGVEYPQD
jgi:dihydrodiol dehydrogenase / D-xylose 1-dehydrogenase (NADP)